MDEERKLPLQVGDQKFPDPYPYGLRSVWDPVPQSQNIEDRRGQDNRLQDLMMTLFPVTQYSMDDWKQMVQHPFTPLERGYYPPSDPTTPLAREAGSQDIGGIKDYLGIPLQKLPMPRR